MGERRALVVMGMPISWLRLTAAWFWVLALSFGALGCKSASSDSVVVVTASGDLAGIRQLRVVAMLEAGEPMGVERLFPDALSAQDLALPKSFSLRMPVGKSGRVVVRVTALSESGGLMDEALTGPIEFAPGRVSNASVCFGQCPVDAGVELDAHVDAGSDGSRDSAFDGALDGNVDATMDATRDGAFDAALDSRVDGATDGAVDAAIFDSAVDAATPDAAVDARSPDASSPAFLCSQPGWCVPQGLNTGQPSGDLSYKSVWNGAEMIVWGGLYVISSPTNFNDMYRWSPRTRIWTQVVQTGAIPQARRGESVVWTGTEMVVWGGYTNTYLNDGYRWNPGTGVWTQIVQTGAVPPPRTHHSTVWTGSEMIIWGGTNPGGPFLNDGYRLVPSTGVWSRMVQNGSIPSERVGHSAVWTGSEMVVWGGWTGSSSLGDGYRWSLNTGAWSPITQAGSIPTPRSDHLAVWTGAEMLVWGGFGISGDWNYNGFRWTPSAGDWSPMNLSGALPSGSPGRSAVWTETEMIVWGIFNSQTGTTGAVWRP